MTDLKTVIENAIEANLKYGDLLPAYDQDAVATAIRDHFLDREKVRAALIAAISEEFSLTDIEGVYPGLPNDTHEFATSTGSDSTGFNINVMVDRLIAGLAGGSE